MKRKLFVSFILFWTLVYNLFALKLPTGDSVRASNVKQDGDSIIEVVLGGEEPVLITTPIGSVYAEKGSTVSFYKSGALKSLCATYEEGYNEEIDSPIGKIVLTSIRNGINDACEFYESGSPKLLFLDNDITVNIGGYDYSINGEELSYQQPYRYITFYDSGSKDKWIINTIYGNNDLEYNEIQIVKYKNKLGEFQIFTGYHRYSDYNRECTISFYKNGSVKSAPLYKSPSEPIVIKDNEVFIKGGKLNNEFCYVTFHEDGSIKAFTSDEVCLTKQGGIQLNIPAGTKIKMYRNGNIRECKADNDNTIKIKGKTYKVEQGKPYLFSEDGSLKGFYNEERYSYEGIADTFYSDGSIKRLIKYSSFYSNQGTEYYYNFVSYIFNPQGKVTNISSDFVYLSGSREKYYYPNKENFKNIAMVYFDDKGNPVSYSLIKLDENGEYLLDEWGFPIEDTVKKSFIKK